MAVSKPGVRRNRIRRTEHGAGSGGCSFCEVYEAGVQERDVFSKSDGDWLITETAVDFSLQMAIDGKNDLPYYR